ncbi:MAG: hypothetical protein ACK4GW_15355, partial [Pseudorhodobacter sp.]
TSGKADDHRIFFDHTNNDLFMPSQGGEGLFDISRDNPRWNLGGNANHRLIVANTSAREVSFRIDGTVAEWLTVQRVREGGGLEDAI